MQVTKKTQKLLQFYRNDIYIEFKIYFNESDVIVMNVNK